MNRTFHIRKRQRMFIKLYEKIRNPYTFGGYYFRDIYTQSPKRWQDNDRYVVWNGWNLFY